MQQLNELPTIYYALCNDKVMGEATLQ